MPHLFEKIISCSNSLINRYVFSTWFNMISYPLRQFIFFILPCISFISKYHQSVVIFWTKNSTYTLTGLTHGIKSEKIIFSNSKTILQKTHSCFQSPRQSILIRYPKYYDTPAIMPSEIYSFRNFSSSNWKEHSTSSNITSFFIIIKS